MTNIVPGFIETPITYGRLTTSVAEPCGCDLHPPRDLARFVDVHIEELTRAFAFVAADLPSRGSVEAVEAPKSLRTTTR
jgi:hypothetical protein